MKQIAIMIKPASSSCNLRCTYCFYADLAKIRETPSFGMMTKETTENVIDHVLCDLEAGDRLHLNFQGGEPTLAGLDYFRMFVELIAAKNHGVRVHYSLQTNGMALDDAWADFLRTNHFLVGLSLDILPDCHDGSRVDPDGNGTYQQVLKTMRLLDRYHVDYNILCTLTRQIARHPAAVWEQIKHLGLRYVQFTPCLDDLKTPGDSQYALTPELFASFYNTLFPLWYKTYQEQNQISIKLFDDLIDLIAFGIPSACGMNGVCQSQFVVEADGSVYPCDFYCLDEFKLGSLREQTIRDLYEAPLRMQFTQRKEAEPRLCAACPYKRLCGGNCKRMQHEMCCDQEASFCGYQAFLDECGERLAMIAAGQKNG